MTVAALPTPLDSLPLTLAAGEGGGGGNLFWIAVVLLVLTAACLGAAAMTVLRNRGVAAGVTPPTSTLNPTSAPNPLPPVARPDPEVAAQIAELRSLVLHARQTVERLEGMLEEAGQARAITSSPVHRETLPDPVIEAAARADLPGEDGPGADDDANDLFGLSPSPTAPAHAEPKPSPALNNSGEAPDLSHIIYQLADDGLSPVQIAQRLSQHTGKVELILALRNI